MNIIYPEQLKEHLIKKLFFCYIFLGEDTFLINKNQNLILNYASQKGFKKTYTINVEKNHDYEKIINFYKKRDLFFTKTNLIVNFCIKTINTALIKNIDNISLLLNEEVLTILKFNNLSLSIKKILERFYNYQNIVYCFTPYNLNFTKWIQYEIEEKNLNIEKKALFLLSKYYEGNTLFIYQTLDKLSTVCPKSCITVEKIKKIIIDFYDFSVLNWIDAIFQGKIKKAIYILNVFEKKKYHPLILIRSLQTDLLKLIYIKREKKININTFLKKHNVSNTRYTFFLNSYNKISNTTYLQAIQKLVTIEINIKKKYNSSIWNQLKELTLMIISACLIER